MSSTGVNSINIWAGQIQIQNKFILGSNRKLKILKIDFIEKVFSNYFKIGKVSQNSREKRADTKIVVAFLSSQGRI
jgi:hypothetical protein